MALGDYWEVDVTIRRLERKLSKAGSEKYTIGIDWRRLIDILISSRFPITLRSIALRFFVLPIEHQSSIRRGRYLISVVASRWSHEDLSAHHSIRQSPEHVTTGGIGSLHVRSVDWMTCSWIIRNLNCSLAVLALVPRSSTRRLVIIIHPLGTFGLFLNQAVMKASRPNTSDSTSTVSCGVTIMFIRRANNLNKACTEEDCNKKVTLNEDGTFRCDSIVYL